MGEGGSIQCKNYIKSILIRSQFSIDHIFFEEGEISGKSLNYGRFIVGMGWVSFYTVGCFLSKAANFQTRQFIRFKSSHPGGLSLSRVNTSPLSGCNLGTYCIYLSLYCKAGRRL